MRFRKILVEFGRYAAVVACGTILTRCGGNSPSAPSNNDPTITLTAAGPVPTELDVAVGTRVLFVNDDARPHAMSSDPVQTHTDCPAINDVGTLAPGQSRMTSPFTAARTCGYHDHTNEFDTTWKGRIVVQ